MQDDKIQMPELFYFFFFIFPHSERGNQLSLYQPRYCLYIHKLPAFYEDLPNNSKDNIQTLDPEGVL